MRDGWRLAGHLHGGAGGLADGTRETTDLERELQERAQGGWRAACTGEQAKRGPALWKQQTESVSRDRAPPSISRSSGAPVCSLDRG